MNNRVDWKNWILEKNRELADQAIHKSDIIHIKKSEYPPSDDERAKVATKKGYTIHHTGIDPSDSSSYKYSIKHKGKQVGNFYKNDIGVGGKMDPAHDHMFDHIVGLVRTYHEKILSNPMNRGR